MTLLARTPIMNATAASLALVAAGCGEDVVAPAVCPDFCPAATLIVVDTVIPASIERDSSYVGYVAAYAAKRMQVARDSAFDSDGMFRFQSFIDEINGPPVAGPVVAVDSFRLQFDIARRSRATDSTEIVVHRLPAEIDATWTYDDLQPYFEDSTEIGAVLLPDSLEADSVSVILPGDAFPALEEDSSSVTAVGLAYRSAQPGFVDLITSDSSFIATILIRYVQIDSSESGVQVPAADTVLVLYDSFVFPQPTVADPTTLTVGSSPSIRTFLRTNLPSRIVDSSSVVRATVLLVPSEPVLGVTGDSILIYVDALSADVGAKSPVIGLLPGLSAASVGFVAAGQTDTIRIEVTEVVRAWKFGATLPRTLSLRAFNEGGSATEARFHSSRSTLGVPILQVSFVPPVVLQLEGGQ